MTLMSRDERDAARLWIEAVGLKRLTLSEQFLERSLRAIEVRDVLLADLALMLRDIPTAKGMVLRIRRILRGERDTVVAGRPRCECGGTACFLDAMDDGTAFVHHVRPAAVSGRSE
jgi:hypothetical protein